MAVWQRVCVLLIIGLGLNGCATQQGPVSSGPNLLVAGDTAAGAHPRGSQAYQRVQSALVDELTNPASPGHHSYRVYDESLINSESGPRSSSQILDATRSLSQPPIDTLILFSAFSQTRHLNYTTKLKTRLVANIIQVHSGRKLGYVESESTEKALAPNCSGHCFFQAKADQAAVLARDVAVLILAKLAPGDAPNIDHPAPIRASEYELIFEGFSPEEGQTLEGQLAHYAGYQHHRLAYQGHRRSEIWLETAQTATQLHKALSQSLNQLGVKHLIQLDGNRLVIKKISVRKSTPVQPSTDYEW